MTETTTCGPDLACGVAGWSYDDWRDTVYRLPAPEAAQPLLFESAPTTPVPRSAARYAADPLAFLARYVDMVEVNSSFYRIPTPTAAASWARRVADRPTFFFTAKLAQEFTHESRRDAALAAQFREAMAPLREAGRLRALLAQFRYDAADTPERRDLLRWLCEQFATVAHLVVEVRHASWQAEEGSSFLRELGVSVAVLDYPVGRDSFTARRNLGAPEAYFRLHGRNYTSWFARTKAAHEPYNYDYTEPEIGELADTARQLLPEVRSLTIVANNHYRGKGVSAALRLKSELLKQKVAVPPALLETYPNLRRIAAAAAGSAEP
jgi:uncharacterized protein YecE (DUF72 family)